MGMMVAWVDARTTVPEGLAEFVCCVQESKSFAIGLDRAVEGTQAHETQA